MIDDNKFKVKTVEINDGGTYGKFVCEPLDRGYGITLGNSLRLLSMRHATVGSTWLGSKTRAMP